MTHHVALMAAREFFDAYLILSENNERVRLEIAKSNPFSVSPSAMKRLQSGELKRTSLPDVVCLAFSLELSLKSLIIKLNGSVPKRHKLKDLFDCLPAKARESIIKETTKNLKPLSEDEFLKNLAIISNAFFEWRYFHEHGSTAFMPRFSVSFAGAIASEVET